MTGESSIDENVQRRYEAHRRDTAADHSHGHEHDHGHEHEPSSETLESGPKRPIVRRHHDSSLASTSGWSVWAEHVFDAERVDQWIDDVTKQPGLRRLKAVLHTNEGWYSVNIADGAVMSKPSAYRRDSRLELIWMGSVRPKPGELETSLLSCLVQDAPTSAERTWTGG